MSAAPDLEDTIALVAATAGIAAALVGLNVAQDIGTATKLVLAATLAVASREIGQRTIAQLMNTRVDSELSVQGLGLSVLTGAAAYITGISFVLIFPLHSVFHNKRYESWGYDIDVPWVKRRYWIAWVGVASMLVAAFVAHSAGQYVVSRSISIYVLFQMVPLKETPLIEGELDGAHILIHSGFMWLLLAGLAVLGAVSPL